MNAFMLQRDAARDGEKIPTVTQGVETGVDFIVMASSSARGGRRSVLDRPLPTRGTKNEVGPRVLSWP